MYLQRHLKSQIPSGTRQFGDYLYAAGKVRLLNGNQWRVEAQVKDEVVEAVTLSRQGTEIVAACSCPDFETDGVCRHVWAAIRAADTKSYLLGTMGSGPPALTHGRQEDDLGDVGMLEPEWEGAGAAGGGAAAGADGDGGAGEAAVGAGAGGGVAGGAGVVLRAGHGGEDV